MKKLHLITLVAVSLLIASCSTSGKAVDNASIQGDWMILTALGINTSGGEETPYIKFDGKEKVNGFAGVNRFFGSYQCTKGKLTFSSMGMTRMMGPNMQIEDSVSKALDKVDRVRIKGTSATLYDAQGKAVITMKRK